MNKNEFASKKNEFIKPYFTGKYSQKKIAKMVGVSELTISTWSKDIPEFRYEKTRLTCPAS